MQLKMLLAKALLELGEGPKKCWSVDVARENKISGRICLKERGHAMSPGKWENYI